MMDVKKALELDDIYVLKQEAQERMNLIQNMVGSLYPSILWEEVTSINYRIKRLEMDYKFSLDFWEPDHYKNFEKIKKDLVWPDKPKFLEVGTYEGRTATWLLDNMPNIHLTMLDPDVPENFHHNMKEHLTSGRATWIKQYSFVELPAMMTTGVRFDLIYLDGDHNAPGLLEDATMAWRLLNKNGILLFDDYLMEIRDPWFYIMHKEFDTYKPFGLTFHHPKEAIDAFLTIYKGQYEVYIDNYQIGLRKICEIGGKNLDHGDEELQTLALQQESK